MIQPMSLSTIAALCQGRVYGEDVAVSSVEIDSRRSRDQSLFVALPGKHVDGHNFIDAAAENGAAAALVNAVSERLPCVQVEDSYAAIGAIARENRRQYCGALVALTGSSGKTSTKEILAALLSVRGNVLATAGNYNNELGVPLTLLRLSAEHDFAVIEMGAAKAGDIRYLCDFARPRVAILTNAQPAHIEGFGSLDGVANTKGEIFDALPADGLAVINADDQYCSRWQERAAHCRRVTFSVESASADIYASDIQLQAGKSLFTLHCPEGSVAVELPLPGRHMVANALAAAAAALALGVELGQLLEGFRLVRNAKGRLSRETIAGVTLIDDSYNANPGSVRAAIDVLANEPGQRALVLGTMAELGENAADQHLRIAEYAAKAGIERFIVVGEYANAMAARFGEGARAYGDNSALLSQLADDTQGIDAVLIKGSRSAAMEAVVQVLQQQLSKGDS